MQNLRPLFHSLLLLTSASTFAACSTAPGADASADASDVSADASDASDASDAPRDPDGNCGIPPAQKNVPFSPELCRSSPNDGGADAGEGGSADAGQPDAGGTCLLDCNKACSTPPDPGRTRTPYQCTLDFEAGTKPPPASPDVMIGPGDVIICNYQGQPCGRAPAGLVSPSTESSLDGYLLLTAHLEAAAVLAFEHLARDLALHGAPEDLVARALSSADDERRHQRAMEGLCARRGLVPLPVVAASYAPRSLVAFAEDNAIEGCGRETLGALVALHQAEHADTEELRAIMRAIAEDEVAHAELAWDIAAWLAPRLSADERARLDHARRDALAAFHDMTFPGTPMGLPSTESLRFYAASLSEALPLAA